MQRILEPELMDSLEQAAAYAGADFEASHSTIVESFDHHFPGAELRGSILDLGCGPGDITFRFAARFPSTSVLGVDGAPAMLELAHARKTRETDSGHRITFIEGRIPEAPIPKQPYTAIVSNSLLHHLHRPEALWLTVSRYASPGTKIFIADLVRPESREAASRLVDTNAAGEPEILRMDFYNSLLAAFEPSEVEAQINEAGLDELRVERLGDFHLTVFGEKR